MISNREQIIAEVVEGILKRLQPGEPATPAKPPQPERATACSPP